MTVPRSLPALDFDNRPYWTGGEHGQLLIQRCQRCSQYIHPPTSFCPACESRDTAYEAVSGRGRVVTFSVNYRQWVPGLPDRYVIALVAIDEQDDVRLATNIVDCDPDDVDFDMPVQVKFEQNEDMWVPLFAPVRAKS